MNAMRVCSENGTKIVYLNRGSDLGTEAARQWRLVRN